MRARANRSDATVQSSTALKKPPNADAPSSPASLEDAVLAAGVVFATKAAIRTVVDTRIAMSSTQTEVRKAMNER